MIGLVIIFIALIIIYLGVILFAGATFVKISLFALDKLVVFIASWYYTHHYFSVKFSSGLFLGCIGSNIGSNNLFRSV